MSSCVIDKYAYIRAAGVVAGIIEVYKNDRFREMYIYDYVSNRVLSTEDCYNRFVECFEMNCISVKERYNEPEPYTDGKQYLDQFKKYVALGRKVAHEAYYKPDAMRNMIYNLQRFFDACLYQIDVDAYYFRMESFFNSLIVKLWKTLDTNDNRVNDSYDLFEAFDAEPETK